MASVRELGMDEQEQNSQFIEGDGHRDSDVQPSSVWGRHKDAAAYPHEAHCPDGKVALRTPLFTAAVFGHCGYLPSEQSSS
ncbi:unnamed protein product [Bubo scandiacus]